MQQLDERLIQIVPSKRQLEFQQLEFYAFVHFTVNTFTGMEWGNGKEDPKIFLPLHFNAKQWVDAIKSAGMKGLILTCKHHDGFCLWPSKYTTHTVAASPYEDGKGDIVREVSDACREADIKFGVYLSPWDRNNRTYGQGKAYDDYFISQLTELLTEYGEIFDVWFDGACGEGENGKRQFYDWDRYYDVIRRLQPSACINVCGPDIRWCGNEAGDTRDAEWSVVPERMRDTEKIAENSQQADDTQFQFRQKKLSAMDQDLGSRNVLRHETDLIWYPAEVNTSIRPGWFYHEEEDDKVRSLEELLHIYNSSVGGNATFLLNIPPTREGLFHENDVKRLKEIGDYINTAFQNNLLSTATLSADFCMQGHTVEAMRADSYQEYFKTEDGVTSCTIDMKWEQPQEIRSIILKENIMLSQRIEEYSVTANVNGESRIVYHGKVVGYKKIILLDAVKTDRLQLHIHDARVSPTLSFIGVY